jgi:hypothetical protein
VAKWLAHLPFTSKLRTFSMRLEPSPLVKVVGFLRFPPTGKVDRVG